jgi:hypothetical protein
VKARKFHRLLFVLFVAATFVFLPQTASVEIISSQQSTQLSPMFWLHGVKYLRNPAMPTADNYVPNGNFELGLDEFAEGWTYQNDTSTRICRVDSVSLEGDYSYYIWSNVSAVHAFSQYFSIVAGGYYNVSFWAKASFPIAETAAGYYVVLQAKNLTSEDAIQVSTLIKVTTDWTRYEYNWQIPADCEYMEARIRLTMVLANNTGAGNGAAVWTDNVVVRPQVRSIICSQPFLLDYENLPSSLSFSVQFMNVTTNPSLDVGDFAVKLGNQDLAVRSVAYNESTQLYDITVDLPALQKGKYMLKVLYGSHESLNFKGVNVYQYTGNFSFIHWTDVHYEPPRMGFENQLNTTLQLLKNADPEFIIMTGDMHTSEANYQRFYAIMKSIDFDIPIFFANGNHEKESITDLNNAILYMGEKKVQLGSEYPFTFNYGDYYFVGLDSGVLPYSSGGNISDAQYNWLKSELHSNLGKQLIAFTHHPLYFSGKTMFWLNHTVAKNILNLFSDYGVIATFAGHAHLSDISIRNNTTYYTTVSGHNCTHWVGIEPFPPSGFRTIEIINNAIVNTPVTNLFSYYTGEFVYTSEEIR